MVVTNTTKEIIFAQFKPFFDISPKSTAWRLTYISDVLKSKQTFKNTFCFDEGLTLETCTLKLFTVANFRYKLSV